MNQKKELITVVAVINAPVRFVWKKWITPDDIIHWNHASDDWHSSKAENDLRTDGMFSYRMEAKDGSMGFDFAGRYIRIVPYELIEYSIGDGRNVKILFTVEKGKTVVTETFEAESIHSPEMQKAGWQSILDNFKKYVESNA